MSRASQRGVTLVEVLVAVLIFAIGILGLAAMQLNSLRANQTASVRSHATFLAYEMADRMRAAPGDAKSDFYNIAIDGKLPCAPEKGKPTACKPFQRDLFEWRKNLASSPASYPATDICRTNCVTADPQRSAARISSPRLAALSNT